MGAGLVKVNIITLATLLPSPIIISLRSTQPQLDAVCATDSEIGAAARAVESIYPLNLETETESEMGELCVKNLLVCLLRCARDKSRRVQN